MELEQYTSSANARLLDNTVLKEKIKMFENFKASKNKVETPTEPQKTGTFDELFRGLLTEQISMTLHPILCQLDEIVKSLEELKLRNADDASIESNTELKGDTITIEQAVNQSSTGMIDISKFPVAKVEEKPIEKPKEEEIIIEAKICKHKKRYNPECPVIYHQNLDRVIRDSKSWKEAETDPYNLFVGNQNEAKILRAFRDRVDKSSETKTKKMINSIKNHFFF